MATLRSPLDDPSQRRVNFREQDQSYNDALHPPPVRNYSNPAAAQRSYDMNDFLRRSGANPIEQQHVEEQRKASKLVKRQKSGSGRTFRNRFFGGFRSKKSQDKNTLTEERVTKAGAKYMEIVPKDGQKDSDPRNFNDSAWTTAFTTARPSLDEAHHADDSFLDQPPEHETQAKQSAPRPSSRYSLRLSNDHMHQMIGELQRPTESPPHSANAVRHISQVYDPKSAGLAPPAMNGREAVKPSPRESLRHSKSNEELHTYLSGHPKMTLNAELETLRMMRFPTPDLVGASGANDPRLALSSHPTIAHSRQSPSAPAGDRARSDLRDSISSLSPSEVQRPLRRAYTQPDLDVVSNSSIPGHSSFSRTQSKIPLPLATVPATSQKPVKFGSQRHVTGSPSSPRSGAPFYYSESETDSIAPDSAQNTSRVSKGTTTTAPSFVSSNRASHGSSASDAIDPGTLSHAIPSFWEGPTPSKPSGQAADRTHKVRERKLRDRKPSNGATPLLSSAHGSLEDIGERPSPPSTTKYPKDAANKKGSPTTTDAPPMPAVPPADLFTDHASRARSPRDLSAHHGAVEKEFQTLVNRDPRLAGPPPPPGRPSPPPPNEGTLPTRTSAESGLSFSQVLNVASTEPQPPSHTSSTSKTAQNPSDRASDVDARTRISELERKNALLEAALAAMLATAGRLNGCPYHGAGAVSTDVDPLDVYRAACAPSPAQVKP